MLKPLEQFDIESNIYKIESFLNTFSDYKLVYFDSPTLKSPEGYILGGNDFADDKEWYIIGVYDNGDRKQPSIKQTYLEKSKDNNQKAYDDLEVLMSMLKLGELIYPTWEEYEQKDKNIQLLYTDEIIEWCKKFGLPNTNTYLQNNYAYYKRHEDESNLGFSVYLFKLNIIRLFDKFNIWYGLTYDDISLVKKHAPYLKNNAFTESNLGMLKDSIKYSNSPIIRTEYDKKTDTYKMVPYAYDLFTVAYFQLSMLMMNKSDENLYFCDSCGNLFVRDNYKTKNCSICRTYQNIKDVRNYRQRKEKLARQYITEKYKNSTNSPQEILELEKDYITNTIGNVKDCKFNIKNIIIWLNR